MGTSTVSAAHPSRRSLHSLLRVRWSPILLTLWPLATDPAWADGKETLDAARAAYYSLRREGLTSFTCLVTGTPPLHRGGARIQRPSKEPTSP